MASGRHADSAPHGVSSAGGIGKALAEWIVNGEPSVDLSEMSLSRFGGKPWDGEAIRAGAKRVYSTYYDLAPEAK
jgi:4-methylaminobutanoate oxidase (formaldehyde-forming)